jgi:hypothetical protein
VNGWTALASESAEADADAIDVVVEDDGRWSRSKNEAATAEGSDTQMLSSKAAGAATAGVGSMNTGRG